jgi:hypothetical protein
MGDDHIRVLLFKKDRFCPLVAAFQPVNKDFEGHKIFSLWAFNHLPEPVNASLREIAGLAFWLSPRTAAFLTKIGFHKKKRLSFSQEKPNVGLWFFASHLSHFQSCP